MWSNLRGTSYASTHHKSIAPIASKLLLGDNNPPCYSYESPRLQPFRALFPNMAYFLLIFPCSYYSNEYARPSTQFELPPLVYLSSPPYECFISKQFCVELSRWRWLELSRWQPLDYNTSWILQLGLLFRRWV